MGAWGFAQIIGVHGPLSPIMPQRNADDRKKNAFINVFGCGINGTQDMNRDPAMTYVWQWSTHLRPKHGTLTTRKRSLRFINRTETENGSQNDGVNKKKWIEKITINLVITV